jgi:hypothetical protein
VTRRPTPDEVLAQLRDFVPGFGAAWRDSLFLGDDGSFTVHGVFSEFSSYVRAHFTDFDENGASCSDMLNSASRRTSIRRLASQMPRALFP